MCAALVAMTGCQRLGFGKARNDAGSVTVQVPALEDLGQNLQDAIATRWEKLAKTKDFPRATRVTE